MAFNTAKLASTLSKISQQALIEDQFAIDDIKQIGAFDCSMSGRTLVCAAIVVDAKTLQVVEKKTLTKPSPIPYIPGYTAFREGPLILELYYSLEHEPDVLMVDGEGIAHPDGGGLATYVGVELAKPTIGVSKALLCGEVQDDTIVLDGKSVGKQIRTKIHAKPLFISPGNLIGIETAAALCLAVVRPPHKLPEPLHIAHRVADKAIEFIGNAPASEEPVPFTEDPQQ